MARKRSNGGAGSLEGINLLDLAPVRLADWTEAEGRVTLVRRRPEGKGVKAFFHRFFSYHLVPRLVKLDAVGTFAWQRLDGSQRIAEIAEAMRRELGDSVEPAEERLGHFVRTLRREGFLAYPGWDELPAITASSR
ncbi:MAG: PqqD family protein [Thermoanaerobaculia bacterium]|nr:PqqD family protein [Thermoanaerobaculia bacterium]